MWPERPRLSGKRPAERGRGAEARRAFDHASWVKDDAGKWIGAELMQVMIPGAGHSRLAGAANRLPPTHPCRPERGDRESSQII